MVGFSVSWGKKISSPITVRKTHQDVVYEYEHFDDSRVQQLGRIDGQSPDMESAVRELSNIIENNAQKAWLVKFCITDVTRMVASDGWSYKVSAKTSLESCL